MGHISWRRAGKYLIHKYGCNIHALRLLSLNYTLYLKFAEDYLFRIGCISHNNIEQYRAGPICVTVCLHGTAAANMNR